MSTEYRLDDAIEFHANVTQVEICLQRYVNTRARIAKPTDMMPEFVLDMFEYFSAKPTVRELCGDPHVAQMFKNNIPVMHAKMGVLMNFIRESTDVNSPNPHYEFANYMSTVVTDAVHHMDRIQGNVMHRSDFESIARMK